MKNRLETTDAILQIHIYFSNIFCGYLCLKYILCKLLLTLFSIKSKSAHELNLQLLYEKIHKLTL